MITTIVNAPVAATVAVVAAPPGTAVHTGQTLLYLEIMKMEQPVEAPQDGIVSQVHVTVGEQVEAGQRLVTMSEAAADHAPRKADTDTPTAAMTSVATWPTCRTVGPS